jgi:hypothetical protein
MRQILDAVCICVIFSVLDPHRRRCISRNIKMFRRGSSKFPALIRRGMATTQRSFTALMGLVAPKRWTGRTEAMDQSHCCAICRHNFCLMCITLPPFDYKAARKDLEDLLSDDLSVGPIVLA